MNPPGRRIGCIKPQVIERLLIASTATRNASIDLKAAEEQGIQVVHLKYAGTLISGADLGAIPTITLLILSQGLTAGEKGSSARILHRITRRWILWSKINKATKAQATAKWDFSSTIFQPKSGNSSAPPLLRGEQSAA
jgi:hypothetical protein